MHPRTLDLRPVAFGWRVVDGKQPAVAGSNPVDQETKQASADELYLASKAAEEVIISMVLPWHGSCSLI